MYAKVADKREPLSGQDEDKLLFAQFFGELFDSNNIRRHLMGIFGRLFGSNGSSEHNPESVAQAIVERYQQRRARGELRVDEQLLLDLRQALPGKDAHEVWDRFRKRRSRSDPKAEYLLVMEIGVALHDAEHYAQNFKPIMVPRKPEVADHTPPSAANTYTKAVEGRSINGADEDAVLFDGLL